MKKIVLLAVLLFCLTAVAARPAVKRCETVYSKDISVQRFYPASGANGFYNPGQKIPLIIRLKNSTSGKLNGKISCTVRNFYGKTIAVIPAVNFTLDPKKAGEQNITLPPPKEKGYFIVDAKINAAGKTVVETQSAFAVVDPIKGKRDPFFIMDNNKLTPNLMEGYKAIGVGQVCISDHELIFFSRFYKKSANMKEAVAKSLKQDHWKRFFDSDFVISAKIGYDNMWPRYYGRSRKGLPLINDELVRFCSQYAEELARQTKGRITSFKCNNEIDAHVRCRNMAVFGSGAEILANSVILVKALYRGMKKGNPDATLAVLGIYGGDYFNNLDRPFPISKMFMSGLGKNFDFVCIDAYNGNYNGMSGPLILPESGLRNYLLAAADLSASYKGPRTVLNAERGYTQGYNDAFDSKLSKQIALFYARSIIINRSVPSTGFTIHYGANDPLLPWRRTRPMSNAKRSSDMGIWKVLPDYKKNKEYYVPRPATLTIAVAARELAFVKPYKEIIRGGSVYTYVYKKQDGTSAAAIYTVGEDTDFTFVPAVPLTVTDAMGNKKKLPAGRKTLLLSNAPLYLSGKLSPAKMAKMLGEGRLANLSSFSGEGKIIRKNMVRFYLRNNENKVSPVKVLMRGSSPSTVVFRPGEIKSFNIPWKKQRTPVSSAVLQLKNGKKVTIPVNTQAIHVPFIAKKPVLNGSGKWLAKSPAGRLKVPEDVWPKSEIVPEAGNFKLDGTDIYADYWFRYDRENLYFAVKVKDKTHLQRQTGKFLWMEDMVQFVVTKRDLLPKSLRGKDSLNRFGNDEYCFALALSPKGEELQCWSGLNKDTSMMKRSVKRIGDFTFYEVAIPWKQVNVTPKKGSGLRFSFIVQDNNRINSKIGRYHLALTGGVYGYDSQDSSQFKTLILE